MDRKPPYAPVAPRRPHAFTTHGITVVDDYAWLKDENWQEVLRDPRSWMRTSVTISKPKTPTPKACSATPRRCRSGWSRKCAGGSRKTIPACPRPTAPMPICANSARAVSMKCSAAPRATAARPRSCSMATNLRQPRIFQVRRRAAFARSPAGSLERGHQGLGIFLDPGARLGQRRRTSTTSSRRPTAAWCGARMRTPSFTSSSTTTTGRCRCGVIAWARSRPTSAGL